MLSVASVFGLSVLASVANAALGPRSDLIIASKKVSPDGFERWATLAGATEDTVQLPGPLITGNKGDKFEVNVVNKLSNPSLLRSTTIHWHGIKHKKTSWADGTDFVTQCPISQNETFTYKFDVSSQAGTFWYHSHVSTQYCDGLRGPFIVYDPDDPYKHLYDVDDESTIITLADWYHQPYAGGIPKPAESTLINGKGRYLDGPATDLAVVNVQKGKRYRFRVLSMSCEPSFNFAIDGHEMTVIEADGELTKPVVVDNIQIHVGQRYSVVVKANQPVGNYWIRSNPDQRALPGFENKRNLAILRYAGAPVADPGPVPSNHTSTSRPLKEVDLHALIHPVVPGNPWLGGADVNMNIPFDLDLKAFKFTMNGVPYVAPTLPVLLQILSGVRNAQELLPKGSVFALPRNKVIELSIPGKGLETGGPHPFHMHGHPFWVVRSAGSNATNYINPVRRDVVETGLVGDNVTIRFVTDNPGPWMFHCHMNLHLELGLAMIFTEDIPNIIQTHPPSAWGELCPKYEESLKKGIH